MEPGSNKAQGRRYPWQPCEQPPPKATLTLNPISGILNRPDTYQREGGEGKKGLKGSNIMMCTSWLQFNFNHRKEFQILTAEAVRRLKSVLPEQRDNPGRKQRKRRIKKKRSQKRKRNVKGEDIVMMIHLPRKIKEGKEDISIKLTRLILNMTRKEQVI